MIRFSCALLFAAVVPLAAPADDKKDPSKEDKKPVAFSSKAGKFSVTLLAKPEEKSEKVKIGDKELEHHLFRVKLPDRAQVISYVDFPKAAIGDDKEKFVAGVVERNVGNLKGGKVTVNEKIALGKGKHPGRDVRVELAGQKQLYRARVFLVGERLYQVVVLGPDEFVKGKEVDDYLNSFAVEE
jgi:hypothetical protein